MYLFGHFGLLLDVFLLDGIQRPEAGLHLEDRGETRRQPARSNANFTMETVANFIVSQPPFTDLTLRHVPQVSGERERDRVGGGGKMAATGHTHEAKASGQTKAAERESSIIKAKTRTRDRGRGMRWKQGGQPG